METVVEQEQLTRRAQVRTREDRGWRRVTAAGAVLVVVAVVAVHALAQTLIPPLALFGVLAIVVLGLLRWGRGIRVAGGLAALVALALTAPDIGGILTGLTLVRDPFEFTLNATAVVATVLLLAGGIALAVRGRAAGGGPVARVLVVAGILVVPLALGLSTTLRLTMPTPVAQAGDVTVAIAEFAFPERLEVAAGEAAFHITNQDPVAHTFTVEGADVDAVVPTGASVRVTGDLAPGEYRYVCRVSGHDFMAGTLVVE
jgi:plastocyanin